MYEMKGGIQLDEKVVYGIEGDKSDFLYKAVYFHCPSYF